LIVHGKGDRPRVVPLPGGLAAEIGEQCQRFGYMLPGDDAGHLSPRYVGKLATLVLPDDWTLHALRHRFATRAYSLDRDVFTVQQLLGHASPATTRRYVALDTSSMRSTVERVAA
ncbi:MAG: tyrosine-type recombinase/integrase, partial [Microbacterium gubbeenense]|uniref:tyrosine-type recombinase/integrase n=1 Tax=Microbacterium gubbeenense TaxID=159896 RepID=UPI003F999E11